MSASYWVETLGCPKNQVDSEKLAGKLEAEGFVAASSAADAELVVVNTCAFVEDARKESIDTALALADARRPDARVVLTGCMAERYGEELAAALPEVDRVAGFGRALTAPTTAASRGRSPIPVTSVPMSDFDLLNLPRPAATSPWAYVKIAEGCDRNCGFCAIPTFRGPQRSRSAAQIVDEVEALGVREVVLVAQDLASYGRDQGVGERSLVPLISEVDRLVDRVRLLYLYPSDLDDELIDAVLGTGVPYFDLSLQHVSRPLMRRMRRWGDGPRFLDRISRIRSLEDAAVFRSNFIVGYPGETEADHDALLEFVAEARLDWCGFFGYSREEGTHAAGLDGEVPGGLRRERLAELEELQSAITAERRDRSIGETHRVLVDAPGVGRSHREAPEIDGVVEFDDDAPSGSFVDVRITAALGPDLTGEVVR